MSTIKKHHNKKHNKTQKAKKDAFKDTAFYPPIKAFKTATLKVSDLHTIYYELYGNPKGKPVLFIHGGPGGGTIPDYARFFNPKKSKHELVVSSRFDISFSKVITLMFSIPKLSIKRCIHFEYKPN